MPTAKAKNARAEKGPQVVLEAEELRGLARALEAAATALRQDLGEAELLRLADALERLSATVTGLAEVASGAPGKTGVPGRRAPRKGR